MTINYNALSDQEILRMAERERSKVIAAFFRKLFTKRNEKASGLPGGVVAAE